MEVEAVCERRPEGWRRPSSSGHREALRCVAARRSRAAAGFDAPQGRRERIALPTQPDSDFADLLLGM